jgi:hypothetical protein
MSIEEAGFREFSRTQGTLKMEMMGRVEEMPYKSRNFLNAEVTIGCAEVDANGKASCMFISKTGKGVVMTMEGESTGPLPVEVEGYHSIMCVGQESSFEDSLKVHRDAIEGKGPVADEAWLRKSVPEIPRRAFEAAKKMVEGAAGLMEGMMQEMGQAVEGAAKGIAEAMGGAGAPKKAKKPAKPAKPNKKRK